MMLFPKRRLLLGVRPGNGGQGDGCDVSSSADRRLEARIAAEASSVDEAYRTECLRIHRMRLQAGIQSISPLVRDLADAHGIGLHGVAAMLRPQSELQRCESLLQGRRARLMPAPQHTDRRDYRNPWMRASDTRVSYAVSRKGVVMDAVSGSGHLGFMVSAGHLIAAGWLGACWFHTDGDRAHIVVRAELPATLTSAAIGRDMGRIVSHPALDGRDYPIIRAVGIEEGPAVAFTFKTGLVPFEMPWPDLLAFTD